MKVEPYLFAFLALGLTDLHTFRQWRADVLAERLTQLTRVASCTERAQDISARMAQKNGAARAVEVVHAVIGAP